MEVNRTSRGLSGCKIDCIAYRPIWRPQRQISLLKLTQWWAIWGTGLTSNKVRLSRNLTKSASFWRRWGDKLNNRSSKISRWSKPRLTSLIICNREWPTWSQKKYRSSKRSTRSSGSWSRNALARCRRISLTSRTRASKQLVSCETTCRLRYPNSTTVSSRASRTVSEPKSSFRSRSPMSSPSFKRGWRKRRVFARLKRSRCWGPWLTSRPSFRAR